MDYIQIGTIINTHGLRGELKIRSSSDFDEIRYQPGSEVFIYCGGSYLRCRVASFRTHQEYSLVSFEHLEDINLVEKYKGCPVCIEKDARHALPEGEYYVDELVGLEAVDEDGNLIGKVLTVEETNGAQNNLRVAREGGREVLIPNIPEFVREIDLEQRHIVIHVEEGLL